MAGYIGSKSSVTLVDGYTEAEADAEFVNDPNDVITVSGSNVGIGTSSSLTNLSVAGTESGTLSRVNIDVADSQNRTLTLSEQKITFAAPDTYGTNYNAFINYGLTSLQFGVGNTERMRIDSSGNLLVGRTSVGNTGNGHSIRGGDSAIFSRDAIGETVQVCRRNDQGDLIQFRRNNTICGEIVNTGSSSVAYNTLSDYRLKENVVDLIGASARVNQLDVKRFNFIADADTTVDGFLAHEVADVVPEAITGTKDAMRDEEYEVTPAVLDDDGNVTTEAVMGTRSVPKYQGIDQSKLVPLLTAALQEALTEIASLKTRVEALEA